jgi:hypothetical protein
MEKNFNETEGVFPKSEEIRKLFYSFAIEDPECLNETEFYKVIEYYLETNQVENPRELAEAYRKENYFYTRSSGDSIRMYYEDFAEVMKELCLVIKGGDWDENEFRLDVNYEEAYLFDL